MSYHTEYGTIDPNGYLTNCQAEEYAYNADLDENKVDAINRAIAGWAKRDPDGYSEAEARNLDDEIAGILAE